MAQHPIQIHIVVSGETFMCSRDYARDDQGWFTQARSERNGTAVDEGEPRSFDTMSGALLDALQAIQSAFSLMREPGEFMPEIIPLSVDAAEDLPRGDLN